MTGTSPAAAAAVALPVPHRRTPAPAATTAATTAPAPAATTAAAASPVVSRWPLHADDEVAAALAVLRSGRTNGLVHGDQCRAFEAAFTALCRMPHAIALANGTLALELALRALGIGPGDEVIVTPRSFFASAAVVRTVGAIPVFADVDAVSQNITAATIAAVMGPRSRAIIPVHLAGWPCPMPEIMALAAGHGLKVIEDCAQAHGATIDGRPVGSFGDAAAFSFCTDKIMSTGGEGGMLALRDPRVWDRAWSYKDHGKSQAAMRAPNPTRAFRHLHDSFGSNFRLTEMQAAIGVVQFGKLPAWLATRRAHAAALNARLAAVPALRLTRPEAEIGHAYYKYYAFVRPHRLRPDWNRDRIVAAANDAGIPCGSGACPEIYLERAFAGAGIGPPEPLPIARALGQTSLMLPVDPTLSAAGIARMADVLAAVIAAASH
jgi:dTDP-4-amino-4,6-dideoxygalactose transaminase